MRYISSAFEKRYQELVNEGDGFEDDIDAYTENNIFFVPKEARWSKIASNAHTPEIGTAIDEAMRAIEKGNTSLKNVLQKNYANPDLDKRVLGDVVDLFNLLIWIWMIPKKAKIYLVGHMNIVSNSLLLMKA